LVEQIAANDGGIFKRGGGSETLARGTGCSGSSDPKPSRSMIADAAARVCSAVSCSSS
jgi:hypothetical protein